MTWRRNTISLVGLLLVTMAQPAHSETFTFGIVPQQAASKLARLWNPILKHVGARAGITLQFKTAPDIPEFEARLARGEYDFSYMNPYHYTVFSRAPGYQALVRARDKRIKGIVVVRKDSAFGDIHELAGAELAFPAPAAFAASVLPRAAFQSREIDVTPRYVSSHDSVYRSVAKGLFPAGGGVMRTFKNVDPAVRAQLRVLWTTQAYTPHAIASHPRVGESMREEVRNALTSLHNSDAGMDAIERIKLKGFERAHDRDWDDVRALDIRILDELVRR